MTDSWARHAAEWQRPGALVRDPETGISLRLYEEWSWCFASSTKMMSAKQEREVERRAIAAGPVLDDPATRGILLAWLRRASGDPTAGVWFDDAHYGCDNGWTWRFKETSRCQCDSEIDALLEALRWALESLESPVREVKDGD